MHRLEKSERSRRQLLDAALGLFSHQGYRATSVREIADRAGVSIGNVYHHFPDKETIFRTLLEEFREIAGTKRYPFTRALGMGRFPDNIEQLGLAVRESIRQFRPYIALIYVDVIEFDGEHIRSFYNDLGARFAGYTGETLEQIASRLRRGVSPAAALVLTSRMFFNYFSLEILFGVPQPLGENSEEMVKAIADMLRNGLLPRE